MFDFAPVVLLARLHLCLAACPLLDLI